MSDILQKVIDTTEVGAGDGGILNADQSNRFIDYMFDATILARAARTIRMRSNTMDVDKVGVGERLMTVASEAQDTGVNAAAKFAKISLSTTKLRLDWELSSEALEDNIEGVDLEDHIARLMATQAGNDVEDVLLNGTGTGSGLLSAFKGFRKLALDSANVVDAGGAAISKAVFNTAIKALPRKYKQRRQQLRFFTGSNLVQDYLYNLTTIGDGATPEDIASAILRGNPNGPAGSPGGVVPFAFGIPVVEVPLIDETVAGDYSGASGEHGDIHLTFPDNFLVGVKREIVVYREFKPKKDTIEYTMYTRVGAAIENPAAFVVVKNVKVSSSAGITSWDDQSFDGGGAAGNQDDLVG
jgi:hypothetical protein